MFKVDLEEHAAPSPPRPVRVAVADAEALLAEYARRGVLEELALGVPYQGTMPTFRDVACVAYDGCLTRAKRARWRGGFGCAGCPNNRALVMVPGPVDALDGEPASRQQCPGPWAGEPCHGTGTRERRSPMCRPCRDARDRAFFRWVRCACGTRRKVPREEAEGWACATCAPSAAPAEKFPGHARCSVPEPSFSLMEAPL